MGWGDIFSNPGFVSTVSEAFGVPKGFGDVLTGVSQGLNFAKTSSESNRAKSDYEAALNAQKTAGATLNKSAAQMMADDARLRASLLSQTGEIGARLRAVYSQLGDIPAVSPETIAADYGALRARSMDDFANLVKSFTSKQEAQNTTQLGGARNAALEAYQLNENLKTFAPIQQGLDTAAYAEAVKRSTDQSTALSSNRNQILQNIIATLSPQLTAESGLYQPGISANIATAGAGVGGQYLASAAPREQVLAKQSQTEMGNLNATIAKIFGLGPAANPPVGEINWETPASPAAPAGAASASPPSLPPVFRDVEPPSVFPNGGFSIAPGQSKKPWWDVSNQTYSPG